jgi:hypothetical protein
MVSIIVLPPMRSPNTPKTALRSPTHEKDHGDVAAP